jgi:phospholipase C
VFDHTSVLRFLEARFGVKEPNISPWRRSVCGDLTAAFDFTAYGASRRLALPSTAGYRDMVQQQSKLPPPEVPSRQARTIIAQEPGVRPARPLPYALDLDLRADAEGVQLRFENRSSVGICCTAYWNGSYLVPRHYTVGAGHTLTDLVRPPPGQHPALTVYGPNGFLRQVDGGGGSRLEVAASAERGGAIRLGLHNRGAQPLTVTVRDLAYGRGERRLRIGAGRTEALVWSLRESRNWYDLSVSSAHHRWRLAGHVEDGHESISDPANVAPILT